MGTLFYEIRSNEAYIGEICDHAFPLHVHDVVEIVCATAGTQKLTIAGKPCTLSPGDIAIIFPAIPHSYDFVSKDASGVTLIFSADAITEFTYRFRSMVLENPVLPAHSIPAELKFIIQDMQKRFPQEDSPLLFGYVHIFLAYLFTCIKPVPMEKQIHFDLSCQVLHYIGEHYAEPITL